MLLLASMATILASTLGREKASARASRLTLKSLKHVKQPVQSPVRQDELGPATKSKCAVGDMLERAVKLIDPEQKLEIRYQVRDLADIDLEPTVRKLELVLDSANPTLLILPEGARPPVRAPWVMARRTWNLADPAWPGYVVAEQDRFWHLLNLKTGP